MAGFIFLLVCLVTSCEEISIPAEMIGNWESKKMPVTVRTHSRETGFVFTTDTAVIKFVIKSDKTASGSIGSAQFNNARIRKNGGNPDITGIAYNIECGSIGKIFDKDPLEEKEVEFDYAPFGMIGLETALGLIITKLVNNKILSISEALAKLTSNPARIFGLSKGSLSIGADADITIIDKDLEWIVAREKFASKSSNSPFGGWKLKGKAVKTIVGGEVVQLD